MIRLQASPQSQHEMKTFSHDGVIKWKHFPRYWPFVRGIHRAPMNCPHKGQCRGSLVSSLICAWTNGSVNHRDPGDLIRHRAHYDVTVMSLNNYTIVKGNQSVSVDSPHKWPLMMISCFCVILNKLHGIRYICEPSIEFNYGFVSEIDYWNVLVKVTSVKEEYFRVDVFICILQMFRCEWCVCLAESKKFQDNKYHGANDEIHYGKGNVIHYNGVIMATMASQITSLAVVYSTDCLFRRRSKKTSKLRVTGLCVGNSPGPVNSPHKWPVTWKMFPFDDVIMRQILYLQHRLLHMSAHNQTFMRANCIPWKIEEKPIFFFYCPQNFISHHSNIHIHFDSTLST